MAEKSVIYVNNGMLPIHKKEQSAISWMNLKNFILNEKSQTQSSHIMITFICYIQNRQINQDRRHIKD